MTNWLRFLLFFHYWLQRLSGRGVAQDGADTLPALPLSGSGSVAYAYPRIPPGGHREEEDEPEEVDGRYLWVLDPGHGPETLDKQSPELPDGRRFKESEGNRLILEYLCEELDRLGVFYAVTNDPELPDDCLPERVQRANAMQGYRPKLFLSIHCNAGPVADPRRDWSPAQGIETYYHPGSLAGIELASIMQANLVRATGRPNRGVKKARFFVLRYTRCPAVMGETLMFNNPVEVLMLLDEGYLQRIARGYANGIKEVEQRGLSNYKIFT